MYSDADSFRDDGTVYYCGFDQDNSPDYSMPPDDDESSEDDLQKRKRYNPEDILWRMCKTGVSFSALSQILTLCYSVLGKKLGFFQHFIADTNSERI